MTNATTRVAVLFGGRSGEHEVSLTSARAIARALRSQPQRFEVVPVWITRDGRWRGGGEALLEVLETTENYKPLPLDPDALPELLPSLGGGDLVQVERGGDAPTPLAIDVAFPVLHGPFGEDGTVQGLLELVDLPFVGCAVTASAVAMDKVVAKALFASAGLPTLDSVAFLGPDWRGEQERWVAAAEETCGYPCFVKPANMGSSVGITKAHDRAELVPAIDEALRWDRKVLVERAAEGYREIECAVLGNDDPRASVPGEVVPCNEFYDYEAKYLDASSETLVPAELPAGVAERVQRLAIEAFKVLACSGLSRVDFLVSRDGEQLWLNEVNTLPGFTPISMYPMMWDKSGLPFEQLVARLVELGLERHRDRAGHLA